MNPYVTGSMIKELREKNRLTQAELAQRLSVSDKTISKWETAKGYPDISLLEPLASALGVSVAELLSGCAISNSNVSSNMLRSRFYVCPVCGNVVHAMGEAVIHCHGVQLAPALPEEMEPYVERLDFIIGPQRSYPNNCSVVSYGGKTCISMIRNIRESDLERQFFSRLVELGIRVTVESNR